MTVFRTLFLQVSFTLAAVIRALADIFVPVARQRVARSRTRPMSYIGGQEPAGCDFSLDGGSGGGGMSTGGIGRLVATRHEAPWLVPQLIAASP